MYLFELSMSILQVEARIDEESERAKHYLDPTTEEPILKVKINTLCLDRVEYNIAFLSATSFDQQLCKIMLYKISFFMTKMFLTA